MFSSNSFNVCPHCGKANSLNARYCSSCGKQLAVPEEVVVCHKCHKPNPPMASYCGACGAPLRMGAQTKICPKCNREVNASENVCVCGYSFSAIQYAAPEKDSKPAKVKREKHKEVTETAPAQSKEKSKEKTKGKGAAGRIIALFSFIFLLAFVYLIAVPTVIPKPGAEGETITLRPEFLVNMDKGLFFTMEGENLSGTSYATEFVLAIVNMFVPAEGAEALGFGGLVAAFGIGGVIMAVMVALFAISVVLHLLLCIVRLVTGGRSRRANRACFVLAIITTLWWGLVFGMGIWLGTGNAPEWAGKIAEYIIPGTKVTDGIEFLNVGWVAALIPIYYWFFTIFSGLTKHKKKKAKA